MNDISPSLGQPKEVKGFQCGKGDLHKTRFSAIMSDVEHYIFSTMHSDAANIAITAVRDLVSDQKLCEAVLATAKAKGLEV